MQKEKSGTLYVVATPIGNLQDMSLRAVEILKSVDKIAVEDTRHATVLLNHFSIKNPIFSLHEHNEREQCEQVIMDLQKGNDIALISDAGTPLINDPGYHLVQQARRNHIRVIPIPGANAAIAALSVSGIATNRFCFEGFLPAKEEAIRKCLIALKYEPRTMVFYETPHRLMMVLTLLLEVFGPQRNATVAREMTKMYEDYVFGTLEQIHQHFENLPKQIRGEFVLVVQGATETEMQSEGQAEKVLDILLSELPIKQAAALASKITGERKNTLYDLALKKQHRK